MRRASRLLTFLTLSTVAFTACSDSGGSTGDALEQAEASAIFAQLFAMGFGAVDQAPSAWMASGGPQQAPFSETISATASCPAGGSVSISGSVSGDIDESTGNGTVTLSMTESISGCKISHDGVTFTVDGDPNIAIDSDVTVSGGGETLSGMFEMSGGFTYTASDGRAGGCGIDVSVNLSTYSASGSVCGQSVTGTGS